MKKTINYSYIGVAFIILVFGIIFIPKIIGRIQSGDIIRSESRSVNLGDTTLKDPKLSYLVINGERKKVMAFSFTNQHGKTITNQE